jgi:hypothetical protein
MAFTYVIFLRQNRVISNNLLSHHEMKNNHTSIWTIMTLWVCIVCVDSTSSNQLLISIHNISMAYAQQESQPPGASTPFLEWYEKEQKDNLQTSDPLSVKILSPAKDEQVPAGQGLVVSGISTDNTTSDCKVSVIVNAVKPYQQTVANGTGGIDDYSTWNLMITPEYTSIKEGPDNKITSKLECTPNLTKWYSVNVTGISTTASANRAGTEMQTPPFSPSSPIISDSNITSSTPLTGARPGTFSTDPVGQTSNSSLLIYVNLTSNSVAIGDAQTIEARVLDPVSLSQINNAIIELEVTDPSGITMEESSDDDGDISSTVVIGAEDEEEGENTVSAVPGTFTVTLRASAVGYEPEFKQTTFNLVEQEVEDEDVEDEDVEDNEIINDEDSESVGDGSNDLFE